MATQLPNTKNDLIVSMAQKFLADSALLMPYVRDLSMFAVKGTKSISIPKLSGFTVENRAFNTAGTDQVLLDSNDTINLDQKAYISWGEDHADIVQSSLNFRMLAVERASIAQANYVDTQIMNGLIAAAGLSVNGATPADVTASDLLDMREYIMQNGGVAAWSQAVYFVGTDSDKALLKMDEFKRADVYGSANIPSGVIGYLYGAPCVVHNAMPAQQVLCFSKDGFGIAFQKNIAMAEQKDISIGTEGVKVAIDQLFGTGGLELGERGAGATVSPLIAKLTD